MKITKLEYIPNIKNCNIISLYGNILLVPYLYTHISIIDISIIAFNNNNQSFNLATTTDDCSTTNYVPITSLLYNGNDKITIRHNAFKEIYGILNNSILSQSELNSLPIFNHKQ